MALLILYKHVVKLPTADTPIPPRIAENTKYTPFFDNYIGALDGTHIPLIVEPEKQSPYRNRKGFLSQNVLAACTFDLQFCYVFPRWEGSANDQRVLQDAFDRGGLVIPNNRYFLADAGYVNRGTILTPYRNVKYHLKEQYSAKDTPQTKEELFNLRHSSLRNEIERIFGVLKKRFLFLKTAHQYSLWKQSRLVLVLCALHNFIRQQRIEDDIFDLAADEVELEVDDEQTNPLAVEVEIGAIVMNAFQNSIVKEMFQAYKKWKEDSRAKALNQKLLQKVVVIITKCCTSIKRIRC